MSDHDSDDCRQGSFISCLAASCCMVPGDLAWSVVTSGFRSVGNPGSRGYMNNGLIPVQGVVDSHALRHHNTALTVQHIGLTTRQSSIA